MYEIQKTAQMRLNPISPTRKLAEHEILPIGRPLLHKRFAKKRRQERRHVRTYIPQRPLRETLMGALELGYVIKDISEWK